MDTEEASPPFSLNMRVVIPDRQRLPIWGCYTASLWVVPEKASQSLSRKSSSSPPGRPLRILSLSFLSVAHLGIGFSQLSNCYLSSTSWIKYNSLVWWENFFLSFKTCFSQYHIIILVEFYPSLIPRSWIIFTIIILNSLSGRLPISTSFSCFSGVLSCSFIWYIVLCLFILSIFLQMWFLFHRLQDCSSSCFSLFYIYIYIFFNLFIIYFWLRWVFIAMRRLLVVASRGYSSLWCAGFSLQWLLLLQSTGSRHASSVVVARGL